MRTLTWLPAELEARLKALDPAGADPIARPSVDDVLARATLAELSMPSPRRQRPAWLAPLAAVAVITAVVVSVATTRPVQHKAPPVPGSTVSPPAIGPTGIAEQLWADFPVNAHPRPVVLVGDAVVAPVHGFPDDRTKIAFIAGAVTVDVTLPSTPGSRDGYPLTSASDALTLLQGPQVSGVTVVPLHLTAISLTDHVFPTDRGDRSLPAWQLTFAGVPDPAYVLAVAQSARYGGNDTPSGDTASYATVSTDGRTLVVPFVAYQASQVCHPGFIASQSVTQTRTAIIVTTRSTTLPAVSPVSAPPGLACTEGRVPFAASPPYRPGEKDTRTITLDAPLGNRAVVDADGHPYVVGTAG